MKSPWYILRRFNHGFSGGISVPTIYVTNSVLCVNMANDVMDDIEVTGISRVLCTQWVSCRSVRLISSHAGHFCVALCVGYRMFGCRIVLPSRSQRCSVDWDYIRYSVFLDFSLVWCRVGNSKWSNRFQKELRSRLVSHSFGCSFYCRRSINIRIVAWAERW